ncbi:MAG: serine/threonine-protein kinase [Verrucomicrobiota bacterium]
MENRYKITGSLGKGGVSEVLRARNLNSGEEVAIKRLLPLSETHLNEPQVDALQRETLALSHLKHPNVVRLLEYGDDEEGPFAVLELIDGESLYDVITEGALTYPDFLDIATQTLGALAAAEDIRLLHRDLKPGNIMLSVNDEGRLVAKILDFGVSKLLSQPSLQTVDHKGSIIGSVDYVSPEQLDLQPLDHRADLYSLGCILYFCLSQEPPFHGGSPAETVRRHLEHDVKPLYLVRPDIPLIVSDWIMKLIEQSPDDRPVGARHALDLLERLRPLEQVPDARLEDLDEFTAPLSSSTILHQPEMRIEGHHHTPAEKKSAQEKSAV